MNCDGIIFTVGIIDHRFGACNDCFWPHDQYSYYSIPLTELRNTIHRQLNVLAS